MASVIDATDLLLWRQISLGEKVFRVSAEVHRYVDINSPLAWFSLIKPVYSVTLASKIRVNKE